MISFTYIEIDDMIINKEIVDALLILIKYTAKEKSICVYISNKCYNLTTPYILASSHL